MDALHSDEYAGGIRSGVQICPQSPANAMAYLIRRGIGAELSQRRSGRLRLRQQLPLPAAADRRRRRRHRAVPRRISAAALSSCTRITAQDCLLRAAPEVRADEMVCLLSALREGVGGCYQTG